MKSFFSPYAAVLAVICIVYLGLGYQYATRTPAWQVPDEPAHYNYIRQVAEEGRLPVIKMGDWDSDYQNLLTATGFDPQYTEELDRIEYEDHQPPLYYLLVTPLYLVSDGDLTTLRLGSVVLGLGMVLCAFAVVRALFPDQPLLALSTSALVAFIPQHLAMLSGVNNDALAELLVALTFLGIIYYMTTETPSLRLAIGLGVLVGLVLLTKSTVYFVAGIAGLAILWRCWQGQLSPMLAGRYLAAYLIPALLLGGLWWGRNLSVYGGTDFLGLQRHDQVAAGQLQTDDYIERELGGDTAQYRRNMRDTVFHSFWGQFGWMALPMESRVYKLLLAACLGMLIGSGLYLWQNTLNTQQKIYLGLMLLSIGLVLAAFLFYNLQFVQFQGRYLFPALIPLALWGAMGLNGWSLVASRQWPPLRWMSVVAAMSLALLAWYALHTYLIPNLPNWD